MLFKNKRMLNETGRFPSSCTVCRLFVHTARTEILLRRRKTSQSSSHNAKHLHQIVGCFNKMLIRMWISGNCRLFILLLSLLRLLIKHFVLISHISTLLQGWPLITVKWACLAEQAAKNELLRASQSSLIHSHLKGLGPNQRSHY